jgi:uncharacterized ParB-like nuclease family protein
MTVTKKIPINAIDHEAISELQMREDIDHTHVDDLKETLSELPPITVFTNEETSMYWIGDGWHRFLAHKNSNQKQIKATIHPGGREAALKHALGANAEHNALRRTNRDKRKAVIACLKSHSAIFGTEKIKNVAVADQCKVAESFVRKIRKETETTTTENGSTGTATGGSQLDFWDQFRSETSDALSALKARLADAEQLKRFEQEPQRTAEEFEALADSLHHQATDLRKTAKSIRKGINA